jgi:hypothetical protein
MVIVRENRITCAANVAANVRENPCPRGYSSDVKDLCVKMSLNSMGFRAIERVEAENCRLRHYLARLHRQTLCDSKSTEMLYRSIRLLIYYLKHGQLPQFS